MDRVKNGLECSSFGFDFWCICLTELARLWGVGARGKGRPFGVEEMVDGGMKGGRWDFDCVFGLLGYWRYTKNEGEHEERAWDDFKLARPGSLKVRPWFIKM